ncbi:hypothetical protein HPB49_024013 [Dermacentor silvarum]|uniref:Uncharacterized protein n=1 Tax=Dermacentor silvarum TaxID=543639 RepID=A0ACB8D9A9_DERSI|nr:hypothetical protein HPB49_024013 [Dermacentor silvarum]
MPLDRSPSRRGGSVVRRQRRLAASPPASEGNKCRSCCRKFAAFLFSHVGLCALVVGYSVLGAFAFRALEGPYEVRKASQVRALREQTVSRLWDVTAALNVLYKDNWTAAVNEHIREFQLRLVAAVKDGYDGKESGREQQWSFSGAFLYSLTVITTIGELSLAPQSRCTCSRRRQQYAQKTRRGFQADFATSAFRREPSAREMLVYRESGSLANSLGFVDDLTVDISGVAAVVYSYTSPAF